jgi:hypothetical protein
MRDKEFEQWLKSKYPNPNNWRTFRSETRRIAKHKGDLDDIYERDRFEALFESFRYSKREGIPPADDIPHNADPYVTAAFRRQCLKLYSQFYQGHPRVSESWLLPDESEEGSQYVEGAARTVVVNRYERDSAARRACVQHYGSACTVCGFSFSQVYGDIGQGFIHVHHLTELSSIGEEYNLDPIHDLRPVCPNCHAMLHQKKPAYSIEEMKALIKGRA